MAQTRNQVLSLFGASPEQILAKRRREDAMAVLKQQDPFARAGSAIGLGLARMFGGEPAEVTRQRELYSKLEGVNFENPEQMRAAAATLASQFPDRALQLITMADSMETSQQQRSTAEAQAGMAGATQALREAQAGEIEAKSGFVEVPTLTYVEVPQLVGPPKRSPQIKMIPVPKDDADRFREEFKKQYFGNQTGDTSTSNALPEGSATFKTSTGTNVAVLPTPDANGNPVYVTVTDEGNIGVVLDDKGIAALGGLTEPQKPEGEEEPGVLDNITETVGEFVKGRKSQDSTVTPRPTVTSEAEKARQARIASQRGNLLPEWLRGRRYD